MTEADSTAVVQTTKAESEPPRQGHPLLIAAVILGVVLILTTGAVAYLIGTAETRSRDAKAQEAAKVEREATNRLANMADSEVSAMWKMDGKQADELSGGTWAKQRFSPEKAEWEIKRTGSDGCPFEATITIPFMRYATIYHKSKEEADKDGALFPTQNESYYPDKADYAANYSSYNQTLTIRLLYDPDTGWKVRSRRTKP